MLECTGTNLFYITTMKINSVEDVKRAGDKYGGATIVTVEETGEELCLTDLLYYYVNQNITIKIKGE